MEDIKIRKCNKCGKEFDDYSKIECHGNLVGNSIIGFKNEECNGKLIKEKE